MKLWENCKMCRYKGDKRPVEKAYFCTYPGKTYINDAGVCNVFKPREEITLNVQELIFELMKRATFNYFDGEKVVQSLRENNHLWKAVYMTRDYGTLIPLRDIPTGSFNVDTLYIISSGRDDEKLVRLAKTWEPDEIEWLSEDEVVDKLSTTMEKYRVLMVWWD